MPEAFDGGNIALVKDDDIIEINVKTKSMQLFVSEEELAARRSVWQQPVLKASKGLLFKYARQVKDASQGCVTDEI
jgi:dihydroxy-acid dehydratase